MGHKYTFSYQQCYMKMLLIIKVICIVMCGLVKIKCWWLITSSNRCFFLAIYNYNLTSWLHDDEIYFHSSILVFVHLSSLSSFFTYLGTWVLPHMPAHYGSHLFLAKGKSSKSISLSLSHIIVLQFPLVNFFNYCGV